MSFQTIEQPGTIAGRIGKGFGKGLSEQVPKEIERYRLSSGLKKLGKKDLSKQNQFQTLGDIYNIPGMTPELANFALQQAQKQNFLNRTPGQPSGAPGTKHQEQTPNLPASAKPAQVSGKTGEFAFATPSQIEDYKKNRLQEPSTVELNNLAKDIINSGLTQDPQIATQLAKGEFAQNKLSQDAKTEAFRKGLDEALKLTLQGGGLGDYKDTSGQIQKALLDQGAYLVDTQGWTPEEATDKINEIGLELGKAANNLSETGSWTNMFRKSSTKANELREQKRDFEKYGFGEQFDDMAAARLKITPMQTAHVLDPLKNQAMQNEINKIKKDKWQDVRKLDDKTLDSIIRKLTPKDNLYAIEYELRDRGIDINQFKKRISELESAKEIALSPQQKRQQKRAVDNSFLGDILFQAF